MEHQSKLKIALLASVSFLIFGFLCATSVDHVYGNTSALLEPDSHGSTYACAGSLSRSAFIMAAANAADTHGRAKPGDGGGIFLWAPTRAVSIDAGPVSGGTSPSISKVSLNILFCVHTL